ncbi:MAG: TIGR03621 family F420-dependent LLM class oxidoreductase [Ktedonobacteraceae bacterium]|nr:TIGR03621 family F420-dependent LLM class oxidoreductase [Ktedonobacteraceae bacterium]
MPKPFRFAIVTAGAGSRSAWLDLARKAEDQGYSTLLMVDRIMTPFAPLTALAMAAGATTKLRIGSYVFCNDFRHPALLAREVATLDLLSEGRFELGIGAGVGPANYTELGLPFEEAGTRVSRLEEALHIIKQFFTQEVVNFSGKYYTITEMKGMPRPAQKPHPPIILGCGGKRMLSIGAREADIIVVTPLRGAQGPDPADMTPEQKGDFLRERAGEQRFEQIELAQTAYPIMITDSTIDVSVQSRALPPFLPKMQMSTEQAIEHLLEQRDRLGYSYIQVSDSQADAFAPIVARLAGK